VSDAARQYLDVNQMRLAMSGDLKTVKPQLDAVPQSTQLQLSTIGITFWMVLIYRTDHFSGRAFDIHRRAPVAWSKKITQLGARKLARLYSVSALSGCC